jgi:MFS family permease
VLVVALVLLVLGHGLLIPALWTGVAMVAAAQDRGTVLRTQQTAGALARVVGPVLAGLLFDRLAPGAAYLFGAALVVVAAAVLVPVANASTGRAQGPADKVTGE